MKIGPNDEIFRNVFPEKGNRNERPIETEFDSVLKEVVENISEENGTRQMMSNINSVSQIQFKAFFPEPASPTVERVEKFLDILENYQQMLSTPHVDLKDLCLLVDEMEAERVALLPVLDAIPEGDSIKDIINQALITSSVEIMKFVRGDYVGS